MTEEQFRAEFVALRDQLPRGNGLHRYKSVTWYRLGDFSNVTVTKDGTVTVSSSRPVPAPDGGVVDVPYTPEDVWPRLLEWLQREVDRSRASIARGVATRARRREMQLKKVTDAWLAGNRSIYANRDKCACCWKRLTDPESQTRGIGPECWEQILRMLERARSMAEAAA